MPTNSESDAIKRARQDVHDRAAELERAQKVATEAALKLLAAIDTLTKLEKSNGKK